MPILVYAGYLLGGTGAGILIMKVLVDTGIISR